MILSIMRIPPSLDGHGGSQRAWRLTKALSRLGKVHFVLVYRSTDRDATSVDLAPIGSMVESITRIEIPAWRPHARLGPIPGAAIDLATMRSQEAPRISRKGLDDIGRMLPLDEVRHVFAGRLPSAYIVDCLIGRGLLRASQKLVDFDDIMSRYRQREIARGMKAATLAKSYIDLFFLNQAERKVLSSWDAVSVCTDEDVEFLQARARRARPFKVPNVIDRPRLAHRQMSKSPNILFVGNLSFRPNVQGLLRFVEEAWPRIRSFLPDAKLQVVGLNPTKEVSSLAVLENITVFPNVAALGPYYEEADMVIAPILYGGGTRIKILEAVAYGRPVVSTSAGAEGLYLHDGRSILLADTMEAFCEQIVRLAHSDELARRLVEAALAVQRAQFSPEALYTSVAAMFA